MGHPAAATTDDAPIQHQLRDGSRHDGLARALRLQERVPSLALLRQPVRVLLTVVPTDSNSLASGTAGLRAIATTV